MFSSKGRVRILRILADIGELNISEIARRAGLNYATTNQHLRALESHQLVTHKKFGRIRIFRYNEENPKARMIRQIVELWNE
ncbi:ArsR family transcriptional regulator [Candidatus Bathyarchaeota archaeon]|nr:ArsR family transcriptional regulator [Candidatus Bathyarchaeota archaeon]